MSLPSSTNRKPPPQQAADRQRASGRDARPLRSMPCWQALSPRPLRVPAGGILLVAPSPDDCCPWSSRPQTALAASGGAEHTLTLTLLQNPAVTAPRCLVPLMTDDWLLCRVSVWPNLKCLRICASRMRRLIRCGALLLTIYWLY